MSYSVKMRKSYRPSELKALRERAGLTQEGVANELGISERQWRRFEKGEGKQKPRAGHIKLLELLALMRGEKKEKE